MFWLVGSSHGKHTSRQIRFPRPPSAPFFHPVESPNQSIGAASNHRTVTSWRPDDSKHIQSLPHLVHASKHEPPQKPPHQNYIAPTTRERLSWIQVRSAAVRRVHEVLAGVAGVAIVVAVGGHQSRDAKKRGIPRACGGFLTYSIMSWLETRKRYTFETSAAGRGRPGEPG